MILLRQITERFKRELEADGKDIVIGIDGRSAAGKTTLSKAFEDSFDCGLIHMDDFFLPPHLRTDERLSEPGGNIHYERFIDEVMNGMAGGKPFEYKAFNCSISSYETKTHIPRHITVIEGAYSLHPLFSRLYDIRIFCDVSKKEQENRIIKRNGPEKCEIFKNKWIPMEEKYLSYYKIKESCGYVFDFT